MSYNNLECYNPVVYFLFTFTRNADNRYSLPTREKPLPNSKRNFVILSIYSLSFIILLIVYLSIILVRLQKYEYLHTHNRSWMCFVLHTISICPNVIHMHCHPFLACTGQNRLNREYHHESFLLS